MQRIKSILLLFLLSSNFVFAAIKPDLTGFIITNSGDTIKGEVLNINQATCYTTCKFKTESGIQNYHPKEIKGYGYSTSEFSSQLVDSLFLEILIEGEMSLYKADNTYFIKKNDEITVLQSEEKSVKTGSSTVVVKSNKWKGALAYLTSDCLKDAQKTTSNISFGEKQIAGVVKKYNECKGEPFVIHKQNEKWTHVSWGIYGGYTLSRLNFYPVYYGGGDIPEKMTSIDPGIGLILEFSTPRISKNFSIQITPYFSKVALLYQDYKVDKFRQYGFHYHVDQSILTLPLSFKQKFVLGELSLYAEMGILADLQLNSEAYKESKYSDGYTVSDYGTETFFLMKDLQAGILAGIGVTKDVGSFELGLGLRYLNNFNLSFAKYVNPYNDKFSINLICKKR